MVREFAESIDREKELEFARVLDGRGFHDFRLGSDDQDYAGTDVYARCDMYEGPIGISVRFRNESEYDASDLDRYKGEVSFRVERSSGSDTEIDKIFDGDSKFMLYGWISETGEFRDWVLLSVGSLRYMYRNELLAGEKHRNTDSKRSTGMYVRLQDLQEHGVIKDKSEDHPYQRYEGMKSADFDPAFTRDPANSTRVMAMLGRGARGELAGYRI